ncbi:prolactin-releasing peptide [Suricata suricatta]|uniref:prolactin-releasing peptide n=1 Tax=Suricata suricatta TaxID=37032 RepID=UPI00115601C6|nr:prolactin-releasing peptide [Suricata suricatta]
MRALRAWLLGLLLLGLALRGAASPTPRHPMEIRTPGIDPAWYAGRGIRPVGRFGRRRAAPRGCRGCREPASLLPPARGR